MDYRIHSSSLTLTTSCISQTQAYLEAGRRANNLSTTPHQYLVMPHPINFLRLTPFLVSYVNPLMLHVLEIICVVKCLQGSQRDVVYLRIWAQMLREGEGAGSDPMSTELYTRNPNKIWDPTSYLTFECLQQYVWVAKWIIYRHSGRIS